MPYHSGCIYGRLYVRIHFFVGSQTCHVYMIISERAYGFKRVSQYLFFLFKVGCDVETAVRAEREMVFAGYLHYRQMAQQASCPKSVFFVKDGLQKIGSVDEPLHKDVAHPVPYALHCDNAAAEVSLRV